MISLPPLNAGAVHATLICSFEPPPFTFVGALGGPIGVTLGDSEDNALVPISFVADTLK